MYRTLSVVIRVALISMIAMMAVNAQQRPRPGNVPVNNPGTATGVSSNVVTSKLLIFAKNGTGTTSTSVSGEFASQLVTSATVNNEFAVEWSRSKPGPELKAMFYVMAPDTGFRVGGKEVTMPAGAIAVNIPVSMSTIAAGNYSLMIYGKNGSSSKVNINYTGKDSNGQPVMIVQSSNGVQPVAAPSSIQITSAQFVPAVGAPGEPGYERARLILRLRASQTTTLSKLEVDVWSGPWKNPELLTNATNSPLMIFKGKLSFVGSTTIVKDNNRTINISLRRMSQDDIDDQETGPGLYSPADWGHAFAQTTTASFRAKLDGKAIGSFEQSPKKPWQWGAP